MVVKLESLEPDDLKTLINRAIESERGLKNEVKINDEAVDEIVRMAGGDARKTLTILEAAAGRLPETKHAKRYETANHHSRRGIAGHGRGHRAL